jgi:small nuclear ribonucleoprotein (snRNP)-like protein
MKKSFAFILLLALCLNTTAYAKKVSNKTVVGTITAFDGADNFYLTIVDNKGKAHNALCMADLCDKLIEATDENLGGYKGKKVKVVVGKGNQTDAAGNIMGTMDAFIKIELIK